MSAEGKNWAEYIRKKHHTEVRQRLGDVDVRSLWATQSEIELLKYRLVRDEGFRRDDPIVVYRGRMGRPYVIDGHTRARVCLGEGQETILAVVYSTREVQVDLEVESMAARAGGGSARRVKDMPITDRLGEGTEEWRQRRREVLDQ
jgi:hypothetical protein